jgi:hypothetical protein
MSAPLPSFDPGAPFTAAELVQALRAMVAEGTAFLDTLSDDAFFAPQGDRWSPAEHVRHLRKASAPLASALRLPAWVIQLRFGRHRGPSRPYLELRTVYHRALAAGGQAGDFAPSPESRPADPRARRAQIMAQWQHTNDALCRAASGWSESALDRVQGKHPLLGMLSARELLEFTVYHTTHHLLLVATRATTE